MHFGISLEPVINFLKLHPHAGFIIAFLVSFLESLPVIGAIIPGSITMTAMGTMVGAAVLPAYTTFGWAIIGALCGDTISYWLGFRYHLTIRNIWPLKKYPKLFAYGENFFKKHGGKSLVIGRFVGPMRSAIPLVAGVMQMKRWRFFVSAIPSAILWAFAYLLPGVLIGAIAQELPKGKASEFILGFILLMVIFWLLIWLLKSTLVYVIKAYNQMIRICWVALQKRPAMHRLTAWLQQYNNPHEHQPLNYILLSLFSWVLFFVFLYSAIHQGRFTHWNNPVFSLLQSIHVHIFTVFWLWVTMLAELPVILVMATVLWMWLFFSGYKRSAWYWLGVSAVSMLMVALFKWLFYLPRPGGFVHVATNSSFPSGHVTLAMALFGFLAYLFAHRISTKIWRTAIYTSTLLLVLMIAFSRVYLGAHWLLDTIAGLSLGGAILFLAVVLYRRYPCEKIPPRRLAVVVLLCLGGPWLAFGVVRGNHIKQGFKRIWPAPQIAMASWWQQATEHLPIYRLSRLGHPIMPFNVQWVGSMDRINQLLVANRWRHHRHEEQLKSLVERLITLKPSKHMPLFPPLFQDQPPAAVFVKSLQRDHVILELRLWRSGATIKENQQPIWIGNISYHRAGKKIIALHAKDRSSYKILNALDYLHLSSTQVMHKTMQTNFYAQPKRIEDLSWDGRIILLRPAVARR